MKLQLPAEITGETQQTLINQDFESNLQLQVLPEATTPGDMKDFVKGMILLGILADVSISFGDDQTGFKHISGTGFSGHFMAGYLVASQVLLALKAGYVMFGKKTSEDDFGKYEDTYSQIPILFGAYYIFAKSGCFKPYIGLALGLYIQMYKVKWEYVEGGQSFPYLDETTSNTSFGIAPAIGTYIILSGIVLQLMVEYNYLFSQPKNPEEDLFDEFNAFAKVTQEETESSDDKPNYLSFMLGVSFPLGQ